MKRERYKKYFLLGGMLFLLLSLPTLFVEQLRGTTIALLSPLFKGVNWASVGQVGQVLRYESENQILRNELSKLRSLIEQQEKIGALQNEVKKEEVGSLHYQQKLSLLGMQKSAIVAKVLYRDPSSWSSSLWVDVGEETNQALGRVVIAKNSPVILGCAVVGVIDHVCKKQSRVRLITDVALKPSVRAVRGQPQNSYLMEHVEPILRQLATRSDLPVTPQERSLLTAHLEKLRETLNRAERLLFGEGSASRFWRTLMAQRQPNIKRSWI